MTTDYQQGWQDALAWHSRQESEANRLSTISALDNFRAELRGNQKHPDCFKDCIQPTIVYLEAKLARYDEAP